MRSAIILLTSVRIAPLAPPTPTHRPYPDDRITLSDLVLARSVGNQGALPTTRQDLSYDPAVDLSFGESGEDRILDWFTLDIPWPRPGPYEIEVEIEIPDHPPVSRARRLRVTG